VLAEGRRRVQALKPEVRQQLTEDGYS